MSYVFPDEEIEIVKLTAKKRDSGSSTFLFSTDFYPKKSVWGTRRAAHFTRASTEFLSIADNAALSMGDITCSFVGWVKFDTVGTEQAILGKYTSGGQEYLIFKDNTDKLAFAVSGDGSNDTRVTFDATTCVADTWYFFCAIHDATANTISLSVNNATAESESHSTGIANGTTRFALGVYGASTSCLDGCLDSIGIWKRAISTAEREAFYNAGAGIRYEDLSSGNKTSLIAWWDLDERSGVRMDAATAHTGNGLHLTDNNGVGFAEGVGGNDAIWPLLSASPRVRRSIGAFAGNRHNVFVSLWGHMPFDDGSTLCERWKSDIHLHGARVEILYRPKPAEHPHAETGAYTRQVLEVLDASYADNDGTIKLDCRDVWFKTKELSIPLTTDDFPDMDPRFDNQPGPIYFGDGGASGINAGAVGAAPYIGSEIQSGSKEPVLTLFTGWSFTGHETTTTAPNFFVRNTHPTTVDSRLWLPTEFPTSYATAAYGHGGPTYSGFGSSGVGNGLANYSRAVVFSPPVYGHVLHAIESVGLTLGTPGLVTGDVTWSLYECAYLAATNSFTPVGAPLWTTTRNYRTTFFAITWSPFAVQVDPPVPLSPNAYYMAVLSWSNTSDTTNEPDLYLKSQAGLFHLAQARNGGAGDGPWVRQEGVAVAIGLYVLGRKPSVSSSGGTDLEASYYAIAGITPINFDGVGPQELAGKLDIKIGVAGLRDDSSGTYTGSPAGLIENPADIIAFILLNSEFGCGVDSSRVPTTHWHDARARLAAMAFGGLVDMTITLDRPWDAEQLILEICRQARLIFYKDREDSLIIHYPIPLSAKSTAATLTQTTLHDELLVMSYEDTPADSLVNDVDCFFAPDVLDVVDDPALIRKGAGNYGGEVYVNADETNMLSSRVASCSASQAVYGRRQYRETLDFWNSPLRASEIAYYVVDRYSSKQQAVRISVPRRDYYDLVDVTNKLVITHTVLKDGTIHGEFAPSNDAYDSENVPQVVFDTGTVTGEVVDVQEFGPYMILVVETGSAFNYGSV